MCKFEFVRNLKRFPVGGGTSGCAGGGDKVRRPSKKINPFS